MTSDLVKRVNLDLLFPTFLESLLALLAECRKAGTDYWVTEGFRSYARSHQLVADHLAGKGGKAAPAGMSAHNFGLAVDLARDIDLKKKGLQPRWNESDFAVLGKYIINYPLLSWGKSFGDMPHVGLAGFVTGSQLKPLDTQWRKIPGDDLTRLQEVWKTVELGIKPKGN